MSLNDEKKKIENVFLISIYSRYTPKLYLILYLSVKWLISLLLNAKNVSGKKSF